MYDHVEWIAVVAIAVLAAVASCLGFGLGYLVWGVLP